jgi:hypothetical protein
MGFSSQLLGNKKMTIEYLHPSVRSTITDNSFVFQTAQGTTVLYAAFAAAQGPDNQLVTLNGVDEAIFTFGEPNLLLYGQGFYNVLKWLAAGGQALCVRVLPDDGAYANLAVNIVLSTTSGGVKHVTPAIAPHSGDSSSIAAIKTYLTTVEAVIPNGGSEGSHTYKLGMVIPKGRGAAYNGMAMKLVLLENLDNTYNFRTYSISFTKKDVTGADVVVDGPYTVSFDRFAKSLSRESMYWANVINKYSTFVSIVDNSDDAIALLAAIADAATNAVDIIPNTIDPFFGINSTNLNIVYMEGGYSVDGTWVVGEGAVDDPTNPSAFNHLGFGTDSASADANGNWTSPYTEVALLTQAYEGSLPGISGILDKKQYPIDIMLDANNDAAVKNAMSDLAQNVRGDCMAILDCSFQANVSQTIALRTGEGPTITMSSRNTAIFAQDLVVYDAYNGEDIKVTSPYFLATLIPFTDNNSGIQYPFVGPLAGAISGFTAINFLPNEPEKESLYKAQINYIERDPKRTNFGSQLTSQTANSALSDINNVRSILRMQRDVENMVSDDRFKFNDATTLDSMNYDLNQYLQKWVANRACSKISGTVYRSDYDRQQRIARVKIELTFTGIIERIFVDFIVNK